MAGIFRRRWFQVVVGLIAILVVVVLLAPSLVGMFAPGFARSAIDSGINGTSQVGRVSLSWFGEQRIESVRIVDAQGRPVADLSVRLSRGLLGLLTGGTSDLGTVTISGKAAAVRNADGSLNIATLAKTGSTPSTPGPSGSGGQPAKIPTDLHAAVVLDKLTLEYTDERAAAPVRRITVPGLAGSAALAGLSATLDLSAPIEYQKAAGAAAPGGSVSFKGTVSGFADSSGVLTPEKATMQADVEVKDLAVAVADALAGMDNRLVAAVGETLQASIKAKGSASDSDIAVAATSTGLTVDLGLKTASGLVSATKPGVVSVRGAGLLPLIPGLAQSLERSGMTIESMPDVRATIDSLKVPMQGKDLRGGAIELSLETGETRGTVRVPQADGTRGPAQAMRVAPFKARLSSADLAEKATLTASTSATIGSASAGDLAVDLSAGGLGGGSVGRIQGTVKLTGVATALAQPLVERAGVQLAQDVGPVLSVTIAADPLGAAPQGEPGLPPTSVRLEVASANLNASANAAVKGQTVRIEHDGAVLRVGSTGPLLSRVLAASGVAVRSGLPVTATLGDVTADLSKLGASDLRGFAGQARVETGAGSGTLAIAGEPSRNFELAPVLVTVDAMDLAKGLGLKAAGAAKVDGQPAGKLAVDVTAMGLIGPDGRAGGGLPAMQGEATIADVSTAIAQPFVEAMGLDLPGGVGPKVEVQLTASSKGGDKPLTDLDLAVKSAGVNGAVALTIDGRTIRKRGGDAAFSLRSPGTLAGKAARKSGVSLSEGGYAKATLRELSLVLDEKWSPRLEQSAADVEVNVGGFGVAVVPASGPVPEAVALGQVIVGAKLAPGAAPAAAIKASGKHQGADFFAQGDLRLPGLIDAKGAMTPASARPLGTIDLNNFPTSLASLGLPAPTGTGQKTGMDLARLVRDAVGPAVTVKLAAVQPQGQSAAARAVSMNIASARFNGEAEAVLDDATRALRKLDFRGQVSQELAAALIDMLGAGLESRPNLVSPAAITISATPFSIPVKADGSMDLARAGDAAFKVGIEGKALVNNVVVKGQDGKPRDLGTVGLENVLVTASVPLSSLAPGSGAKPAQATVTAGVLGAADKRIIDLRAGAKVDLASGAPRGDLNADASLKVLDAAWLDSFLGQPGLLAEGLGADAAVDLAAVARFPQAGAPAGSEAPAFERATVTGSIKSANLATAQPLKATVLPDRASIDAPVILKWKMLPGWGNRYVLGPPAANEQPLARFTTPTDITVSLFRLAVARGAPLKPGVFLADVQVDSPGTTLAVGAGKEVVPTALKTFMARVTGGKDPGTLGFNITMADAGGGPGPGGKPAVSFAGGVYGVADAAGVPTPDAAKITMEGTAAAISTPVVDALAHQNGLLNEALGPRVDMTVKAQGLSKSGGNVDLVATSPRAEARLSGVVRNGTLALSQPPGGKPAQIAKINEATPKLGAMLVKGLPAIGSFEKRPEDGPAVVNAYAMAIPIDGDLRKLNGQVVVDLGQAHFATSEAFRAILKVAHQKDAGAVGQRMDPFEVDFKNGVGTYQKFVLPLGEFRLATSGTIDLVNKQMDVVTYVPFGALADEAAGKLNTGLGKLIGGLVPKIEEATMVPVRTRGSFEKPKTEPDVEEFGRNFINTVRPDKLIKDLFK